MRPRPHRTTLFPYTTLFRSGINNDELGKFLLKEGGALLGFLDIFSGGALSRLTIFALGIMPYIRDRKSTRLNSSHTVISYAVFCLKKKNARSQSKSFSSCTR